MFLTNTDFLFDILKCFRENDNLAMLGVAGTEHLKDADAWSSLDIGGCCSIGTFSGLGSVAVRPQIHNPDALQPAHMIACTFAHTANLAVSSLFDGNLQNNSVRFVVKHDNICREGFLAVQNDSGSHFGKLFFCNRGSDSDTVRFGNMLAGVHNIIGKFSVPFLAKKQLFKDYSKFVLKQKM
jgi:hypothetical protein